MPETAARPSVRPALVALALALGTAAVGVGCLGADVGHGTIQSASTAASPSATVTMKNLAFSPLTLKIAKGTTVTFTNADSTAHTVTPDTAGAFAGISNLGPGQSGTVTFPATGTFFYHCVYHGAAGGVGMAATVSVQ